MIRALLAERRKGLTIMWSLTGYNEVWWGDIVAQLEDAVEEHMIAEGLINREEARASQAAAGAGAGAEGGPVPAEADGDGIAGQDMGEDYGTGQAVDDATGVSGGVGEPAGQNPSDPKWKGKEKTVDVPVAEPSAGGFPFLGGAGTSDDSCFVPEPDMALDPGPSTRPGLGGPSAATAPGAYMPLDPGPSTRPGLGGPSAAHAPGAHMRPDPGPSMDPGSGVRVADPPPQVSRRIPYENRVRPGRGGRLARPNLGPLRPVASAPAPPPTRPSTEAPPSFPPLGGLWEAPAPGGVPAPAPGGGSTVPAVGGFSAPVPAGSSAFPAPEGRSTPFAPRGTPTVPAAGDVLVAVPGGGSAAAGGASAALAPGKSTAAVAWAAAMIPNWRPSTVPDLGGLPPSDFSAGSSLLAPPGEGLPSAALGGTSSVPPPGRLPEPFDYELIDPRLLSMVDGPGPSTDPAVGGLPAVSDTGGAEFEGESAGLFCPR